MNKQPTDEQLNQLIKIYESGDLKKAEEISLTISRIFPTHPLSWKFLGIIYEKKSKFSESLQATSKAIELSPNDPELYFNLGKIYFRTEDLDRAEENFNQVITYKSDFIGAYIGLGLTFEKGKKFKKAESIYKKGIELRKDVFELYFYLGNTLQKLKNLDEAIENFKKAIKINPQFFGSYSNLGNAYHILGKFKEAIENYEKAIQLNNKSPETFNNFGNLLRQLGNLNYSEKNLKAAIVLNPNYAKAFNNLGNTYRVMGKLDKAINAYEKAINIDPKLSKAEAHLIFQKKNICDFSISDRISKVSSTLGIKTNSIGPFSALSWNDNPEEQLLRSKNYIRENFSNQNLLLNQKFNYKNKKIKIGYFSADFYDFPSMHVMIGLLEKHNKDLFEIFAFSFGPNNNDWMNKRIKLAVDHFIDVANLSTREIIEMTRKLAIDIAIDENGFTFNARTELFQNKLSPIQINFMGYPGTLGADFIDYIVADNIVIPKNLQKFYSEKIIYLPNCFMPSDNLKLISNKETKREDYNLPKDAFVLCCFNKSYKISSSEFDIWMRILKNINKSVLWLLKSNDIAMENLQIEAKKRGINPDRIIFADKIPIAEHLNRHKHADLFVDTFNYNAHVTTNDSLWAGLPVVTKEGSQFSARVSSSLLYSIGLEELVAKTNEDYERIITELAFDPNKLLLIKEKLFKNRSSKPLFNTELYAKNFESGLQEAYLRYTRGETLRNINVIDNL